MANHRKNPKRVKAGKKAARTRKRNAAKRGTHRSGGKRSTARRKSSKAVRAGHRAWNALMRKHGGKAGAVAFLKRKRAAAGRKRKRK